MRRILPLLLAVACFTSLAADQPKPKEPSETEPKWPKLTPDQLADGWINLFDRETLVGWKNCEDAKWSVKGNHLVAPRAGESCLVSTTAWEDYELKVEYTMEVGGAGEMTVGVNDRGWQVHNKNDNSVTFRPTSSGEVSLCVYGGAIYSLRHDFGHPKGPERFLWLRSWSTRRFPWHIRFTGNGFAIRTIQLRPRNRLALLNGKDLSEWKEVPDTRAKFSVTQEGYLSVKGGPGALTTEGMYDDFVLQLECKTNGKHLNSGVFFRAPPGQPQQGYEAAIHHAWLERPRTAEVEEFAPNTHESRGKRFITTPAIQYGTGGITPLIPTRKQLAEDNEWFALTIAANGRHISTWVNGIQTVDWTDNRPQKENARQGCRRDKGTISLQAHDPTTELLFKNLRIADLGNK
jgi:hypothetical protein